MTPCPCGHPPILHRYHHGGRRGECLARGCECDGPREDDA